MIRWSQIMYMYYFLGYQLKGNSSLKTDEEKPQHTLYLYFYLYLYLIGDSSLKTDEEKRQRANNTFLLALDGDVDFQPDAIVKVSSKKAEEKFIQSSGCRLDEKKPKDWRSLW